MDALIARRLDDSKGNPYYDAELYKKLGTTGRQYLDNGMAALNNVICDYDCLTDLVEMWMPLTDTANFNKLDRNSATNFRHPATFSNLWTMTTFIAEILFGGEVARTVEAQDPNHDESAEAVNGLLAWNDAKTDIYFQGWLWIWNAVVYNRGVWFESADQDIRVDKEEVDEPDPTQEKEQALDKHGNPRMRGGKPVMAHPKRSRVRSRRTYSGFYNKLDLVSPYDFICDPALPLCRAQEMRFMGHRVMIPWIELKRRSELDPSDDAYVLPHVVKKIKTQKGGMTTPAALGGQAPNNTSRTYFDRTVRGATGTGLGGIGTGLVSGADSINKDDGGTVECFSLTIRQKPKTIGLYPDDEEQELITLLITNQADVLSVNVRPNQHDQFPYCISEARPSAHKQFSPSWGMACKPIQDRMDDLNRTHSQAQKRMGNILIADGTKCNLSNILDPEKNGLIILRTKEGQGLPIDDICAQIKLEDTTAKYNEEMAMWEATMEKMLGITAQIKGITEDPSQTATQNDNVQTMATGSLSSKARTLAAPLRQQTVRFVENFKQFMPDSMMIRILGKGSEFDPDDPQQKFMEVKKADIQHGYDVIAHDGALPGADVKVVAAATRTIEAWAANDKLAPVFDITIPGAIDPFRLARDLFKKTGLPVEKYSVTREQAMNNLRSQNMAQGAGVVPGSPAGPPLPQQAVGTPPPVDATGMPSASALPPIPSASPPPPGTNLP